MAQPMLTRFLQPLLAGRRAECFSMIQEAADNGMPASTLLCEVIWPAMSQVDRLFRDDRISGAAANMATRINRTAADQLQARLPRRLANGKRAILLCTEDPQEEIGCQIVADLFGAEGWEVYFLGGGVPDDEILTLVGQVRPDVLVIFGTNPQGAPLVRNLIGLIRDVNACPSMNIIVSGGVFNRADGLWREVGADVFADAATDVLSVAATLTPRAPGAPTRVGVVKKRRRRRKLQPVPA